MTLIDKTFAPADFEQRWYAHWETSGQFRPARSERVPFTIVIPPPNVTGSLHIGHALDNTLQDVLIRYHRLKGRDARWVVGTDHAGIATQMVVERQLAESTQGTTRQQMGREAFVETVWEWKETSGSTITRQLRRLGASCDWAHERFTMDEGFNKAVTRVFVQLYNEGLLYRDKRLVNWDPKFKTAISDLEVETREVQGTFTHIRYPLADGVRLASGADHIIVATTRPETMLGDTAVAVNARDERYQSVIGKFVRLPITGRLIPIVADDHADPELGSGAVKITPAHDFNDFDVGKRHDLAMINIFDADANVIQSALSDIPAEFLGLHRFKLDGIDGARELVVSRLEADGFVELIEAKTIQMPYGDRSGVVVEPWLTDQWYVNAGELAKPALAAVHDGRTQFVPKTWEKTYFNWMENIQPWCVSRQLWWGHRIPAWYGPKVEQSASGMRFSGFDVTQGRLPEIKDANVFVAASDDDLEVQFRAAYGPDVRMKLCSDWEAYRQWFVALLGDAQHPGRSGLEVPVVHDEDVLDTWFSSALWPFATLGWPEGAPPSPVIPAKAGTQDAGGEPLGSRLRGNDGVSNSASGLGPEGLGSRLRGNDGVEGGRQRTLIDPAINPDLARHYPGDVLVTGFDIIFFWVARMMMQGLHFMDEVPFRTVYCHGLVRDAKGAKMAKSKGNTVDPLVLVDKYGADALRFTLTAMESQGRDIKMDEKRVEGYRNFATKLWNAARFCQSNGISGGGALPEASHAVNRWIIGEVAATARALDAAIAAFRFDAYADTIYQFVWNRFCDWYLELTKPLLAEGADAAVAAETRAVTGWALDRILVMLHPVMPFLTEELWHKLAARDGDLIVAAWPDSGGIPTDAAASADVEWLIGLVSGIRAARSDLNVPPSAALTSIGFATGLPEVRRTERLASLIMKMGNLASLDMVPIVEEEDSAVSKILDEPDALTYAHDQGANMPVFVEGLTLVVLLGDSIDLAAERARLTKSAEGAEKEAASLASRLASPGFVDKARPEAVEKARADHAARSAEAARLRAALARLG